MKGITEERLRHLLNNHEELVKLCRYAPEARGFIDNLLKHECTELNPWQPMTGQACAWNNIESAPKDRPVLLYGGHVPCCQMFVGHADANWYWKPAHWCELPLDPPSV